MIGIICDVGHTIITDSIINKILSDLGHSDDASVLYDEKQLLNKSSKEIDDWVQSNSSRKLSKLKGVSLESLEHYCQEAKLTKGVADFVTYVSEQDIPLLFIGAVPSIITDFLLQKAGINSRQYKNISIKGTPLNVVDNKLDTAGDICTPSKKKEQSIQWLESYGVNLIDLVVIGDSLGDIPVMSLAQKANRFGIHVNSTSLNAMISQEVSDFNELSEILRRKIEH